MEVLDVEKFSIDCPTMSVQDELLKNLSNENNCDILCIDDEMQVSQLCDNVNTKEHGIELNASEEVCKVYFT